MQHVSTKAKGAYNGIESLRLLHQQGQNINLDKGEFSSSKTLFHYVGFNTTVGEALNSQVMQRMA